jgi:NDP-sugar pyrophosphorylase family protein
MKWKILHTYFREISSEFVNNLFNHCEFPWSPLSHLSQLMDSYFLTTKSHGLLKANRNILSNQNGSIREGAYYTIQSEILNEDFIDQELKIRIGAGTLLEAGATIKNHTIIERNCEIRQGAYLRGNTYIGECSVVGHATEMKNSIFTGHVEAGHFAYIGDSIVGAYVNLGAGTKISNLEFRTLDAKQRQHFPEIIFSRNGKSHKTNLSKFGAIIGDGCETGCNSVLCPFVILEPQCWIMPNIYVLKGIYPKGSLVTNSRPALNLA